MTPNTATFEAPEAAPKWARWPVATVLNMADLPAGLSRITDAAVCLRKMPETVAGWLDDQDRAGLPEGRFILTANDVAQCVEDLFAKVGHAPSAALAWLCEDLSRQAHCLSALDGETRLRLRVERITNNACSKFHIDSVVSRLICTYRGPGTQIAFDQAFQNDPLTLPTGMPILLKGKRWSQANPVQLLHRSPPIEGTGLTRFITVLEAVAEHDLIPHHDRDYHNLNSL